MKKEIKVIGKDNIGKVVKLIEDSFDKEGEQKEIEESFEKRED